VTRRKPPQAEPPIPEAEWQALLRRIGRAAERFTGQPRDPQMRAALERIDRASERVARWNKRAREAPPPPRQPKRKRRAGAGRPPVLTPDEIERGRDILRRKLRADPKFRHKNRDEMAAFVRGALKLGDRLVSDTTLKREIVRPVLRPN